MVSRRHEKTADDVAEAGKQTWLCITVTVP